MKMPVVANIPGKLICSTNRHALANLRAVIPAPGLPSVFTQWMSVMPVTSNCVPGMKSVV
jgi:hypothetical protein